MCPQPLEFGSTKGGSGFNPDHWMETNRGVINSPFSPTRGDRYLLKPPQYSLPGALNTFWVLPKRPRNNSLCKIYGWLYSGPQKYAKHGNPGWKFLTKTISKVLHCNLQYKWLCRLFIYKYTVKSSVILIKNGHKITSPYFYREMGFLRKCMERFSPITCR